MQFHLSDAPLMTWTGSVAVLFGLAPADENGSFALPPTLADLDRQAWDSALSEIIQEQDFSGKPNTLVSTRVGAAVRKVILVGLGSPHTLTLNLLRRAAAAGIRQAQAFRVKEVAVVLPPVELDSSRMVQAIVEGVLLASHQDNRFKSQSKLSESAFTPVESMTILLPEGQSITAAHEQALTQAEIIAAGTLWARELVSAPANVITPVTLAEAAQTMASEHGLEARILGQADCEELGMGAFLGVAKASDIPPQFIHLIHKPAGDPDAKLAIIGKGLTFDSGGLNIKTDSRSIAMMKVDMGGAATVLGAAQVIADLKPNLEIHFIVAATENMISGRALHPGDILTASNQKTIEINNTDAEGRLTLADALVYAEKLNVDAIVDLATLTGACVVALGEDIGGLFTQNEELAAQLQLAAHQAGEKIWRLPMEDSYFEGLNSVVADMKNTGPRPGGSITAALFLKQFVEHTPWAHWDVAGPVWTEKESGYNNKGGTGYGVRTLVEWILSYPSPATAA